LQLGQLGLGFGYEGKGPVDRNRLVEFDDDVQEARHRRLHFIGHLLGFDDQHDLTLFHWLAFGKHPLDHLALLHRHCQFGHYDFLGHGSSHIVFIGYALNGHRVCRRP
jgi:hypothetical protein